MLIVYTLLLYLAIEVIKCQQVGEDGYMHIDNKRKLKLYEPPIDVQNYKYPEDAPPALLQTWAFSSYPWIKLKFTCSLIRIPQNPPCENYYLEIHDGVKPQKFCGEIKDLVIFSFANQIEITLKTGKLLGGGIVNCQIEGFNPEFTTLAPPTTTQSYLTMDSIEIDSSEHGVTPGTKKTTCPCGWTNKNPGRIVGGTVAKPNEYPYMAALVSKEVGRPFCGATIITHYHAITAAHCTIKLLEYNVDGAILVGEHDYTKDSNRVDVYDIKKIILHELYKSETSLNDISLIVTKTKIEFNPFIGRVCLPTKRLHLDNQNVLMLGWGRTGFNQQSSPVLRKVYLRIVPMRDCLDVWSLFIPEDNPKHLCTFGNNKTTCKGDSGGPGLWRNPLTNRYELVGLTSFGLNCSPNIPSVKTEVAAFLDWIHFHTRATSPSGDSETCHEEE